MFQLVKEQDPDSPFPIGKPPLRDLLSNNDRDFLNFSDEIENLGIFDQKLAIKSRSAVSLLEMGYRGINK